MQKAVTVAIIYIFHALIRFEINNVWFKLVLVFANGAELNCWLISKLWLISLININWVVRVFTCAVQWNNVLELRDDHETLISSRKTKTKIWRGNPEWNSREFKTKCRMWNLQLWLVLNSKRRVNHEELRRSAIKSQMIFFYFMPSLRNDAADSWFNRRSDNRSSLFY